MKSIISWNVNYDDRATGEFEEYGWEHRKDAIGKFITSHLESIFHLQEVMPKYMKDLQKWIGETHNFFTVQVHPCGRQLVSAYPISMNNLEQVDVEPPSEKHRRVFLRVENDECVFINAHFPMAREFRQDFTKQLCDLTKNETRKVVVTGDFNSFPDGNGFDQTFEIQREGNLYAATSVMIDSETNKRVLKTFERFPYDVLPKHVLEAISKAPEFNLDHIFVKGVIHKTPRVYVNSNSDHYAIEINFD